MSSGGTGGTGGTGSAALVERTLPDESAAVSVRVGTQMGRYHVLDKIGEGSMGEVFSAYDLRLNRRIAVKILGRGPDGTRQHTRLLAEAQALAKLDHPNVVKVFDIGPYADTVFVAMEYVHGRTLEQWLKAEKRHWREIGGALLQAGRGLEAAHAAGLVHRDFKPTNVIVTEAGDVRVLDFGLARSLGDAPAAGPDDEPDVQGTPAFMAPEQFDGHADPRSDQFAFCVVLYRALYGRRPFAGRTFPELAEAVSSGAVIDPPTRIQVPMRLRAAVLRGLRPKPADRFASMAPLLAEVEAALARRRRRIIVAASVGAAALITAFAVQSEPAVCDGGAARLKRVWNPERREEIENAFDAVGKAYSDRTLSQTRQTLDVYADAWVAGYRDACEATRVHGEQSTALMDRRMACLTRRLSSLAGVVDAFSKADEAIVRRAVRASEGLPRVEDCADRDYALAQVEPPDQAVALAAHELDARIAEAVAMRGAGDYKEAFGRVDSLLEEAEALGYLPTLAAARALDGTRKMEAGDWAGAEASFELAFMDAQSSGDHLRAAEAAVQMAFLFATSSSRPHDALQWARHADAAARRGAAPPTTVALVAASYASGLRALGKFEAALVKQRESAALLREQLGPTAVLTGASVLNAASMLTELGRYDEALTEYGTALAMLEDALGPEHPSVAQARENLGTLHFYRGENDEAAAEYKRALEIREKALSPGHAALGRSHSNVGAALVRIGQVDASLEHQRRSVAIFEAALGESHPSAGNAYNNLGAALRLLGRLDEAEEALNRALEIQRSAVGSRHPRVVMPLRNLGAIKADRGLHAEAVPLLEEALSIALETLDEGHTNLALTRMTLGQSLVAMGARARAVEPLEKALATFTNGPAWEAHIAWTRFALATAIDDDLRARELATQARATIEKLNAKKILGRRGAVQAEQMDRWLRRATP